MDHSRHALREPHVGAGQVVLRPARPTDVSFLYILRTDPLAAWASAHPPPSYAEHTAWLARTLTDPARRLYVAEDGLTLCRPTRERIGTARLDLRGEAAAEVSLTVAPWRRSQGIGRAILAALDAEAARLGLRALHATVRPEHDISIRLFSGAGYKGTGALWVKAVSL